MAEEKFQSRGQGGNDISEEEYEKELREQALAILTSDNKEASFNVSASGNKSNIEFSGNFEGMIFAYGALTYSMSQKTGISPEAIGRLGINVAEFMEQAVKREAAKREMNTYPDTAAGKSEGNGSMEHLADAAYKDTEKNMSVDPSLWE